MAKNVLLLTGLLLGVLSGCIIPQPPGSLQLPDDFEVSYSTGAVPAAWGRYGFEADATGNASFTKSSGMVLEKKQEFTVNEGELLGIYNAAIENNFFGLQGTYQDTTIMDGGSSYIVITANGSTKGVSVVNTSLPQFSAVANKIRELIISKVGEKAFSFEDLKDDCGAKKIVCEPLLEMDCGEDAACEEEQLACSEWKEFCGWETSI